MQRRIQEPNGDRQSRHDLEQLDEIGALHGKYLGERRTPSLLAVGQDHLAHGDDTIGIEEHVLRPAQTYSFRAEGAGNAGVERRLGVGPYLHAPDAVRPAHENGEISRKAPV